MANWKSRPLSRKLLNSSSISPQFPQSLRDSWVNSVEVLPNSSTNSERARDVMIERLARKDDIAGMGRLGNGVAEYDGMERPDLLELELVQFAASCKCKSVRSDSILRKERDNEITALSHRDRQHIQRISRGSPRIHPIFIGHVPNGHP